MSTSETKPVLLIDGNNFDDFAGFTVEFSRHLAGHEWKGSLDAFNDILFGGFGTPQGGFILRWKNSARSRKALSGPGPQNFETVVSIVNEHCKSGNLKLELL